MYEVVAPLLGSPCVARIVRRTPLTSPCRLVDMFLREHVLLLWIMEGETYLRVHQGIVYFYHDDGAFQPWKGCPPEAC